MSLELKSIEFVRDFRVLPPRLSIRRRNPDHPDQWMRSAVIPPEWPPVPENNGLSPVMIPLSSTSAASIRFTPIATLESTEPGAFSIEARPPKGVSTILGRMPPTRVEFGAASLAHPLPMELDAPRLSDWSQHRVDFHVDEWIWEATPAGGGAPFEFARSAVQVYTTLGVPRSPWKHTELTDRFWLEVLQLACCWARGATSADEIATLVTQRVFALGQGDKPLIYDTDGHYTDGLAFDAESFLARILDGDLRYSSVVNCEDVASIVTTFANILGADLHQSTLGPNIVTNDVLLLGHPYPKPAEFMSHEVAWGGAGAISDPVWDACLAFPEVKVGATPDTPAGLTFSGQPGGYADRLLQTKNSSGPTGPRCGSENRPLARKEVKYRPAVTEIAPPLHPPARGASPLVALRFVPAASDLPEFRITGWRAETLPNSAIAYLSVWEGRDATVDRRLQVTAVPLDSPEAAHDYLALVVSHFSLPVANIEDIGDVAVTSRTDAPRSLTALIVGNLFLQVGNIGVDFYDTLRVAERLVASLTGEPPLAVEIPVPSEGIQVDEFLESIGSPLRDRTVALRAPSVLRLRNGRIANPSESSVQASALVRASALTLASEIL